MPARSAACCALTHGLELRCDLLQGSLWRGGGDTGHQRDQPVVGGLARRAPEQVRLDDLFRHQAPYRSAQALGCPFGLAGSVQHADHVTPWLGWAHPPHRRQPRVQAPEHAVEMCGITGGADLANGVWVAGA
jgi:hypothetical protein